MQLYTSSMVLGGIFGFAVLSLSGVFRCHEQDGIFTEGMRMMALVGFIMITEAGFASVMQGSGEVEGLVTSSAEMIGDNKELAALIMLLVCLFITMGIGSSFDDFDHRLSLRSIGAQLRLFATGHCSPRSYRCRSG